MATLSINKASQLFKRSRNTIKTMLSDGRLSYAVDGATIDLSELLRVFGSMPDQAIGHGDGSSRTIPTDQPLSTHQTSHKDIEIAVLQERVRGLEALLDEKEKRVQLLENKSSIKPWWRF